jgi:hypothetical protein
MQPRRIVVRNNPNFERPLENNFKYKIVRTSGYSIVDEDFILTKAVKECEIILGRIFPEGKKINIKSLTNTIIKQEVGLIDEEWDELLLEEGSSVQFLSIEGHWYILSSDGLKMG